MNKLVFANLLHRPLRSMISVVAVAIEVIMILSVVGIFMGMLNDQRARTNGIGADLMMMGSGASMFNSLSSASMPVNDAIAIRRLPHVAVVSPAIQHTVTTPDSIEIIWGIDYATFNALKPFVYVEGGRFQGPDDAIVDFILARANHLHLGDTIDVLGHPFRISGIVEPGKGGRTLVPIETMGELMGAPGKASVFYIKCDKSSNQNLVTAEIHSTPGLHDNEVWSIEDWLSQMTPNRLPGFNIAVRAVTGIAVIVGFLVIFQAMYTAVLERTREIGILKSMGASKAAIVSVVLRECGLLAAAGVVLGIAGTFGIRTLMIHLFPTQHFEITLRWAAQGAAIAFVGAICGALYPAWMAARKDPIDALAYE
ncbi:MAG: ABC transporter permease [Terracidiphilus sp.]